MALIRKHGLYQLATIAWGVLVFAVIILTISGNARPYIAPEQVPIDGPLQMVGVAVVLILAGVALITLLAKRSWKRAGKRAGLGPTGWGGIMGMPDLAGTVEGREVTARTVERQTGGGGESGSNTTTFTVVETTLDAPIERGLVIDPDGEGGPGPDELPVDVSTQVTSVGDVGVLTKSPEFAADALGPRALDALLAPDALESVRAGNAADVFIDTIADAGGLAGSMVGAMEGKIRDRFPDADTVSAERKGVVHDGAELEAYAQAVVAVADGVEDAREA